MSQQSRRECLERSRWRYQRAGRKYKAIILDEFCTLCGYERKYAGKLLSGNRSHHRRKPPGPSKTYGECEHRVLRVIWEHAERLCGKRLKPALSLWLPHYQCRYGPLPAGELARLLSISPATIDRLLAADKARLSYKGRCGTKPGTLLRTQIPIRAGTWQVDRPGYLEADTVAHCGGSMAGDFIWSLTYTDIHTGWTTSRAVWNRGAEGVVRQTRDIEAGLPFPMLGFDCDNGGEFLNYHLLKYFCERKQRIEFTRSREYHKNDNAHVEQKNWSNVRQLLGYERLDEPKLVERINDLYSREWDWLNNFFLPSAKLISKERIGGKYRKKYQKPQTPYQRLLTWKGLNKTVKQQLKKLYQSLDPFQLQENVERKLQTIFSLNKKAKLKKVS